MLQNLLVDEAEVWPQVLTVVQVAECVTRKISPGQHQRALWEWENELTGESLHNIILTLIKLSGSTHILYTLL